MCAYLIQKADLPDKVRIIPIHICRPDDIKTRLLGMSKPQTTYIKTHDFAAKAGQAVLVPDANGDISCVLFGAGLDNGYANSALRVGSLAQKLAPGFYEITSAPKDMDINLMAVAWGMGAYKFSKYLSKKPMPSTLVLGEESDAVESMSIVKALHFGRDLINTPASDMGPVALQGAAQNLADIYGATLSAVIGDDLLAQNYPMIHAVGRAAHEVPRLVELEWGDKNAPRLALVGKGITFDTGGVNMKSAVGMRMMKKDMGGAAHALALAEMIMAAKLPIRLHVLLAVAENSVSGNAFRPGDVLSSRKGLTVEIDNTDAEGRLVLGDALTKASESDPALIIDFATLTGAARVAMGPTIVPFFSNTDAPIAALLKCGEQQFDPIWNMPLWSPYMSLLRSPIADMKNSGSSFGGALTAALFLQKFVGVKGGQKEQAWMHFDVYGWNPSGSPARPEGGEIMSVRAVYHWLKNGGLAKLD
ncbi:MAG: leucyl aminopeptidase family protein [Robiginitomaculum sp.]|nr:leucyl aminopeptidase family protein [Robiginitomaculum sp.]